MPEANDSHGWTIKPFDDGIDARQLRTEWEEWLETFEFEAATKRNFTQSELFNLLMAKGGRVLQRIYKNKEPVAGEVNEVAPPRAEIPVFDNASDSTTTSWAKQTSDWNAASSES